MRLRGQTGVTCEYERGGRRGGSNLRVWDSASVSKVLVPNPHRFSATSILSWLTAAQIRGLGRQAFGPQGAMLRRALDVLEGDTVLETVRDGVIALVRSLDSEVWGCHMGR